MSLEPSLEEQSLLADTLRLPTGTLSVRERRVEAVGGALYVACVAALLIADPPHRPHWLLALLAAAVMCVASRVQFDTPLGFTVATQLAFVPLLFAVPLALVPIVVPVVMMAAHLPEVWRAGHRPSRLVMALSNSWFALGPVAVFAFAGVR